MPTPPPLSPTPVQSTNQPPTNQPCQAQRHQSCVLSMTTASCPENARPSTNSFSASLFCVSKTRTSSAALRTGRYARRTYFFAGTMRISAGDEEAKGAVRPGHRVEQVRVLRLKSTGCRGTKITTLPNKSMYSVTSQVPKLLLHRQIAVPFVDGLVVSADYIE